MKTPQQVGFRISLRALFVWITLFCVLFGLAWMVIRSLEGKRHEARRMASNGRAKYLIMAIHNYYDHHQTLPSAQLQQSLNSPPYSWRVAILPFMEGQDLYAQYDRSQTFNSPANDALCKSTAGIGYYPTRMFQTTGDSRQNEFCTDFVVVSGPGTLFPDDQALPFSAIADDPATTIVLVEIDSSDILWYEPRDLRIDQMSFRINDPDRSKPCLGNRRARGAIVAMADGSVHELPQDTPPETLRAMLTIAGGELVELPGH